MTKFRSLWHNPKKLDDGLLKEKENAREVCEWKGLDWSRVEVTKTLGPSIVAGEPWVLVCWYAPELA